MKELKQIFEYDHYTSDELQQHRQELQEEIQAINAELNSRRNETMDLLCLQLHNIFEEAKKNAISIEIGTEETYVMFNPAKNQIPDITLQ